jgi:hypothetical protein
MWVIDSERKHIENNLKSNRYIKEELIRNLYIEVKAKGIENVLLCEIKGSIR